MKNVIAKDEEDIVGCFHVFIKNLSPTLSKSNICLKLFNNNCLKNYNCVIIKTKAVVILFFL